MKINKYGIMALLAISCSILHNSCGSKSKLFEKLEELSIDGKLDCKDLEHFTQYVQQNKEDRSFKKLIKNGQADKIAIQSYMHKNANKAKLNIDQCGEVKTATNFAIYLENSASMDGYVNGVSNFESVLSDIVIGLNYHFEKSNIKFNFINSEIYPVEIADVNSFFSSLEPGKAPFKVGNQFVSELNQCFEKVLSETKDNGVSIFVSDCIYSLGKGRSTQQGLILEENMTKSAFMQRLKKSDLSTCILQFTSGFNGTYYDYNNQKTKLQQAERPYYIWIIGADNSVQNLLSKVRFTDMKGYQNSYFLTGIQGTEPSTQYLSGTNRIGRAVYRSQEPNYIKDIQFVNGVFQYSIAVDMSSFPDRKSVLENRNYVLSPGATLVSVQEIPSNNQPILIHQNDWQRIKDNKFTHIITVKVNQKEFPNELTIAYKNAMPSWVESSSNTDDSVIRKTTQQTFGLRNLLHGVTEAYKTHNNNQDILFQIKYNLAIK